METDRLTRGLAVSFGNVVTHEWRLLVGTVLSGVGYLVWVGLTAAVLSVLTSVANISTAVDPWTNQTIAVAGVASLLWVLLPAAGVVWLMTREVTNQNGNIQDCYRVSPAALLAPPMLLLACCGALLLAFGSMNRPVLAAAVFAALFLQIRTLIYSYRVFSFSYPIITQVELFVATNIGLLALLVEFGRALGRGPFVNDAVAGFSELVGVGALSELAGTTTVVNLTVPTLPALAVGVPLTLSLGYVSLQMVGGVVVRFRTSEVPRSRLRTGQRYPEFARPTTSRKTDRVDETEVVSPGATATGQTTANGSGSSTQSAPNSSATPKTDGTGATTTAGTPTQDDASTTADDGGVADDDGDEDGVEEEDEESTDEMDEVTHTRVFTPDMNAEQTEVMGSDDAGDECPYCEADLEPGAESCPNCNAILGEDLSDSSDRL